MRERQALIENETRIRKVWLPAKQVVEGKRVTYEGKRYKVTICYTHTRRTN